MRATTRGRNRLAHSTDVTGRREPRLTQARLVEMLERTRPRVGRPRSKPRYQQRLPPPCAHRKLSITYCLSTIAPSVAKQWLPQAQRRAYPAKDHHRHGSKSLVEMPQRTGPRLASRAISKSILPAHGRRVDTGGVVARQQRNQTLDVVAGNQRKDRICAMRASRSL